MIFTQSFLKALLWSSMDEEGNPLDGTYSVEDIDAECAASLVRDCEAFQESAGDAIIGREDQAGHDFCLTRNRHGVGFWDGKWPEHGEVLSTLAHGFPEIDLYAHEGKLYT